MIVVPVVAVPAFALNNDGTTDLYWRKSATLENKGWWLNGLVQAGSVLSTSVDLPATGPDGPWRMIGTGDFDRDGQLDIAFHHSTIGYVAIWYMNGTGFKSAAFVDYTVWDTTWQPVAIGYFGGPTDNKVDLLWLNTSTGQVYVWHLDNYQLLASSYIETIGQPNYWKIGGAVDMDENGVSDIYFHSENPSDGWQIVWYLGGGYNTTWFVGSSAFGPVTLPNWKLIGVGYFNADTSPDLLWRITSGDGAGFCVIWHYYRTSYLAGQSRVFEQEQPLEWDFGGLGDAKLDTDADGMPDLWERNYFGTLSHTGGTNGDGDAWTDLQEYRNGTNPTVFDAPLFSVETGFEGIGRNEAFTDNAADTMGAIGPSHYLETVNHKLAVFSRTPPHTRASEMPSYEFFNVDSGHGIGDMRVWYDHFSGRWIASFMDRTDSKVIVKISHGSSLTLDPNSWYRHEIQVPVGTGEQIDFPTLGLDKNGIYVSVQTINASTKANKGFWIQCL